ncbi:MAG TPA: NYN domain-containing protein [Luteolibacter sp.]|nr:NYN domain-containing protein [Luteolibacter sp.]
MKSLAVLIDADNATPDVIVGLLEEVAGYGTANVKRIYGDWTTPNLGKWKAELLKHSIQPIQQFRYTTGKNATDSAMIIDAMDLLYTSRFSGFCIVSSDSDFTRLASRIREQGLSVYGFGERKTPEPFVKACDKFIYTDVLGQEPDKPSSQRTKVEAVDLRKDTKLVTLIDSAIKARTPDGGDWAVLGAIGHHISQQFPEFDSRNYGYAKLSGLLEAMGLYEIERTDKQHPKVRRKKKAGKPK